MLGLNYEINLSKPKLFMRKSRFTKMNEITNWICWLKFNNIKQLFGRSDIVENEKNI